MKTLVGTFVISLCGHDKGLTYLVVGEEERCVLLADGKTRRLGKPKCKNKKHILPLQLPIVNEVAVLTDGVLRKRLRELGEDTVS